MAQKKGKCKSYDEVSEYVERILNGSDELAEGVIVNSLPRWEEFKRISILPEINMASTKMVKRLLWPTVRRESTIDSTIGNYKISRVAVKGKWRTYGDYDAGVINISDILQRNGWDTSPSAAMELVGSKACNCRVNMYPMRGILAIMYACAYTRRWVEDEIKLRYPDPIPEPDPEPAEIVVHDPVVPTQYAAAFSPEFIAELVRVCVRESVAAALAAKANT